MLHPGPRHKGLPEKSEAAHEFGTGFHCARRSRALAGEIQGGF